MLHIRSWWRAIGHFGDDLDRELMKTGRLTTAPNRLPRQHVRLRRCFGPGQGRNRPRCHSRGQERKFRSSMWNTWTLELTRAGHYQVARQARLHPTPHGIRDQGGRRHQVGVSP
ncbi:ubiquinol-cytochrome c reductase iron-sulfur subunit [Alternaria alternata]|nr:ubiquinol-cytochrome c reductase iron-sulfur subunit [Alternaria alternata]